MVDVRNDNGTWTGWSATDENVTGTASEAAVAGRGGGVEIGVVTAGCPPRDTFRPVRPWLLSQPIYRRLGA